MLAHNVLGYTNGMHPNLSKVTMHLNSLWTNYPTHLYKPLIIANGKQNSTKSLNVCVYRRELVCVPVHTSLFHIHMYTQTQQSTKCMHRQTISEHWTLWLHRVVNWQLQIPAMRYNQFHLHLLCLLLHILGVIVIGMNGLSGLIMAIVSGPECKKAWWECINTKMVHQHILFVPAKTSPESLQENKSNSCTLRHWRNSSSCKRKEIQEQSES